MKTFLLLATLLFSSLLTAQECVQKSGKGASPCPKKTFTEEERVLLAALGGTLDADSCIVVDSLVLNPVSREIAFPARVMCTLEPIEVLISTPRGRSYESLFEADISAKKLQMLLYLSGAHNGVRTASDSARQGDLYRLEVQFPGACRAPVERFLRYTADSTRRVEPRQWVFVGSSLDEHRTFMAEKEGNIILTWSQGQTLFDNPLSDGVYDNTFIADPEHLPPLTDSAQQVRLFLVPITQYK